MLASLAAACAAGPADAAAANAASLETLAFASFRRPEFGSATYAPKVAAEIGSTCPEDSPGFAAALAGWQAAHKLAATGIMDIESFVAMNRKWTRTRPFVLETAHSGCPEPPDPALPAPASGAQNYGGKTITLRADWLAIFSRLSRS